MKICTKCGVDKPIAAFSLNYGRPVAQCKSCRLLAYKAWQKQDYQKNPEKYRAYAAKQRREHPERVKESFRKWREQNPDKARECTEQWKERNPEKVTAHRESRNKMKREARVKWADKVRIRAVYELARRLSEETGIQHHVDHIVPLQSQLVCGLHVEHNLQVLTATMNNAKLNRMWPDMPEGNS